MNKIIFLLGTCLLMAACNQPPSNNPNAKLVPVTFEENLAIHQPREQQFDFYFSKREKKDQRYSVGVEVWIPDSEPNGVDYWDIYRNKLEKSWDKGKNPPYFDVTIEHHRTDGTIKSLPLIGLKHFFGESEVISYPRPPARLSCAFDGGAKPRQDKAGKGYGARICFITGLRLNQLENYQDGFFRFKIKVANQLEWDDAFLLKATVTYPTYHK